jgi:hypothetical protein
LSFSSSSSIFSTCVHWRTYITCMMMDLTRKKEVRRKKGMDGIYRQKWSILWMSSIITFCLLSRTHLIPSSLIQFTVIYGILILSEGVPFFSRGYLKTL